MSTLPNTPQYTEYHPRWYRKRVSTYWWMGSWKYMKFILRELSSIFVALGVGMAMFALHWIGGGDAKIFAGACLWLGPVCAVHYTLTSAVFGGVLTVLLLLLRRFPVPSFLARPWILNLADPQAGVPYGVALALGAIAVLPGTDLLLAHG